MAEPTADVFSGFSEFGAALAEFVAALPDARGAVLSDEEGDPVDFAHRPGELSALDVQILGAQVEWAATRMQSWCSERGLGACEILIEASHGSLLCSAAGEGCVLASLHGPAREVDPLERLAAFANLRLRVTALLG